MSKKDDFQKTISNFNDKTVTDNAVGIREMNPLDSLKNTLFTFFENRLSTIEQEETFKNTVKNALLDKVEAGEVSFTQLMQLYKDIQTTNTRAVDSILDMLKPAPAGTVSLLVSTPKIDEDDDRFTQLNPEDRDLLNKLANFANKISEEKPPIEHEQR